jgi:hypothetical protein
MLALDRIRAAAFQPYLRETFRLLADGHSLGLELIEVSEALQTRTAQTRTPFSVVFKGPAAPHLRQQTYWIQHSPSGAFDLFLGPIAASADGVCYEAVFN